MSMFKVYLHRSSPLERIFFPGFFFRTRRLPGISARCIAVDRCTRVQGYVVRPPRRQQNLQSHVRRVNQRQCGDISLRIILLIDERQLSSRESLSSSKIYLSSKIDTLSGIIKRARDGIPLYIV